MEPKDSLPHSQETATRSSSKPDQSSPCLPTHFLKTHFNIILPFTPGSFKWLLPLGFPTKTLYAPLFSELHATCSAHLILLDLITRIIFGEKCRSFSSSLCSLLHSAVNSSLAFFLLQLVSSSLILALSHFFLKRASYIVEIIYIAVVWTCTSIAGFIDATRTCIDSRSSPLPVTMILYEIYKF